MSDIKIVEDIRALIDAKDQSYLNSYVKYKDYVKKDYDIIKSLSVKILETANSLNIDIPIEYSNKITDLTKYLFTINTLKGNMQLNLITMERIYGTTYSKVFHKYKQEHVIGVKHEWASAFNLAIQQATTKDISNKIEIWKQLISTTEELVQSTMEIIHSGKKTLSVMLEKKW